MRNLHWSFADKFAALVVVVSIILTSLWLLVPSAFFIRDVSMTVTDGVARYVRETPYGPKYARWQAEITLIDGDGYECQSPGWQTAYYQEEPGNTITYRLGEWADTCLAAGPPFYLTTTRRVMLFGAIPLRQMVQRTEVQGQRPGPVDFDRREQ